MNKLILYATAGTNLWDWSAIRDDIEVECGCDRYQWLLMEFPRGEWDYEFNDAIVPNEDEHMEKFHSNADIEDY